ncbi:hypothetical protein [Defluviimonas sp. WL0002]|uniref:hypothetical protein n=1 Tax=Albidovulum marisflavi TaxID=2984159 RepID=UPI0021E7CB88|nr:hypothetical protein [Defluviimonas sp. WL0002]
MRRAAVQTVVRAETTAGSHALLAGVAIKLKIFGTEQWPLYTPNDPLTRGARRDLALAQIQPG